MICLFICFVLIHFTYCLDVTIDIGTIRGKYDRFGDRGVFKFLGIPYAEPPVGELRFRPPVRKTVLEEPYSALRTGPICPQHETEKTIFNLTQDSDHDFTMSEDCLYMNVYVPSINHKLPQKLPVIVYIHSGGWIWGSGNHYDGRWLPLNGNVILVTFNYRLGILGFLKTEDNMVINNGFKDQILAVKFVYENIESFGGDRSKITVLGHSAGSVSCVYIYAVPALRGMIKRVVGLEGVPGSSWASFKPLETENITSHIVYASGCSEDYLNCLKRKTVSELVQITYDVTRSTSRDLGLCLVLVPVPDNENIQSFTNLHQSELNLRAFSQVDMLLTMSLREGTSSSKYISDSMLYPQDMENLLNLSRDNRLGIREIKRLSMMGNTSSDIDDLIRDVVDENETISVEDAMDFITELTSLYPMYDLARNHEHTSRHKRNTFMMTYDYVPTSRKGLTDRPDWETKAIHGDILPLMFGNFQSEIHKSHGRDEEMGRILLTYITNFVKTGDPNEPVPVPVRWSKFRSSRGRALFFSDGGIEDREFTLPLNTVSDWDLRYIKPPLDVSTDIRTEEHHDEL